MTLCGKIVKTIEPALRPCLCENGHEGGCNPFSSNPFIPKTQPPKTTERETPHESVEKKFIDWTLREGEPQCLWQGASGRCVLRLGHFPAVAHSEGKPDKSTT